MNRSSNYDTNIHHVSMLVNPQNHKSGKLVQIWLILDHANRPNQGASRQKSPRQGRKWW